MENKIDIAIIGNEDTVALFNVVGIKTYVSCDASMVDQIVFDLSKANCKIIYISEKLYEMILETLAKYQTKAYPIILPLPLDQESNGIGLKRIRQNVEKAIGINIF